jgi:hypothetical protein
VLPSPLASQEVTRVSPLPAERLTLLVYVAFEDVGGHLSYSAAFLDEAGDGVVLTAINGRAETRSYAKPVRGGRSDHNLSDEERTAIALAMGQPAPPQRQPV